MAGAVDWMDDTNNRRALAAFCEALNNALRACGATRVPRPSSFQLPWDFYREELKAVDAPAAVVRRLRAQYLDVFEPAPIAAVNTPDKELTATTDKEFVALLALLRDRAGLRGRHLAERAGLPVSQLYSMTDVDRAKLPTKGEQVRSLVAACGLSAEQVAQVMRIWDALRALRRTPPSSVAGWKQWSSDKPFTLKISGPKWPSPTADEAAEYLLHAIKHTNGVRDDLVERLAVAIVNRMYEAPRAAAKPELRTA